MNKLIIALTILTVVLLTNNVDSFANTIEVTNDDNNSTIKLKKNDSININLEGNITSGYSWILLDDYDSNLLSVTSNDYQENSTEGKLGTPGNFLFAIDSISTGETELNFSYCQPWDENNNAGSFNIKVSIEDNSTENEENQSSQVEEPQNKNSSNESNSNILNDENIEINKSEKPNINKAVSDNDISSEHFSFIIEMFTKIINITF